MPAAELRAEGTFPLWSTHPLEVMTLQEGKPLKRPTPKEWQDGEGLCGETKEKLLRDLIGRKKVVIPLNCWRRLVFLQEMFGLEQVP